MRRPSTSDFFEAARWVYRADDTLPPDLAQFTSKRGPVTALKQSDGFFGAAFETSSGQVIVSFEGTDLGGLSSDPAFVGAQLHADQQIYAGRNPAAYRDALRFTRRVLAVAAAQGIRRKDVFVDGHSFGGAEAEFVAAKTNLAGETFGAPGIRAADIRPNATSHLVNYVDYGDPIGNYGADPNVEGRFLFSDQIERFGAATYVGSPRDALALRVAGELYGASAAATSASVSILGNATAEHHLLQDYAQDLGLMPAGAVPSWMDGPNTSLITGAISQLPASSSALVAASGSTSDSSPGTPFVYEPNASGSPNSSSSEGVQGPEGSLQSLAATIAQGFSQGISSAAEGFASLDPFAATGLSAPKLHGPRHPFNG